MSHLSPPWQSGTRTMREILVAQLVSQNYLFWKVWGREIEDRGRGDPFAIWNQDYEGEGEGKRGNPLAIWNQDYEGDFSGSITIIKLPLSQGRGERGGERGDRGREGKTNMEPTMKRLSAQLVLQNYLF
jgi:hypothetical protein